MSTCKECGLETNNQFCSVACNNRSYRKANLEKRRLLLREWRARNKVDIVATCTVCSVSFSSSRRTSKYCSKECYNAYRVRQRHNWSIEDWTREKELRKKRYDKMKNNPLRKLKADLRTRLGQAIRGHYKVGSAIKDLGCSVSDFKAYIESKFQPGMSWDNWSRDGWHLDHIVPLSAFDLTDPNELKIACHYTNLRPLWAKDNLRKGDRHVDGHARDSRPSRNSSWN